MKNAIDNFPNERFSIPLSDGQYDLWLENQMYSPEEHYNHFHFVSEINHELDTNALRRAIKLLSGKHESIRTVFPSRREKPYRKILPEPVVGLEEIHCNTRQERALKELIDKNFKKPFHLESTPPFRFVLYRLNPSHFYLQIVIHHIGLSLGYTQFLSELTKLYSKEGGTDCLDTSSSPSFSEFVQHENLRVGSSKFNTSRKFWNQYLSGALPPPILPFEKETSKVTFLNDVCHFDLPGQLAKGVKELGQKLNTSSFSTMTGVFQILLHKFTRQREMIIGVPTDLRADAENTQFSQVFGYTTNTLPLRSELTKNSTCSSFIKQVRAHLRSLSKHRHVPLRTILDDLRKEKGNTFSNLFRITMVSQKSHENNEFFSFGVQRRNNVIKMGSLEHTSIGIGFLPTGRFDLALAVVETGQDQVLSFHYNSNLFSKEEIKHLANSYLRLLKEVIISPDRSIASLSFFSEKEQITSFYTENSHIETHQKELSFYKSFEKHAKSHPHTIALSVKYEQVSYGVLDAKANQLARYLVKKGVTPETTVAVCMDRSVDLIVGILAVLKTSATYLPIDPEFPRERIDFMLKNSKTKLVLTQSSYKEFFAKFSGEVTFVDKDSNDVAKEKTNPIRRKPQPDGLAYVIYTSGSTGLPKGVEIEWKSLENLLFSIQNRVKCKANDKWLALTTISFDISILEILLPLSQGAELVLATEESSKDPSQLAKLFKNKGITIAQATPTTWRLLIDFGWIGKNDLKILCGGEALQKKLSHQILPKCKRLWNMYGPTETTIWSSMEQISPSDSIITIGKPLENTTFHVLDEHKQHVPIGVPGELFIGGIGLARGYRDNKALTREQFVNLPISGNQRVYRTGDLVRCLWNGKIEFLGRTDHQVKIRGYRIELGEIEAKINEVNGIKTCLAVAYEAHPGDSRIAVYFEGEADQKVIRAKLESSLPSYMLPSIYMKIDFFPLTPNGKIDRKSLPKPGKEHHESSYIPPKGVFEKKVAEIFGTHLGLNNVSSRDNFFSLGGHSLLAAKVVSEINKVFTTSLPLKALFDFPTVIAIVKELKRKQQQKSISKARKQTYYTPSPAQKRILFLEQLDPNTALYNIPFVIDFSGQLDLKALQQALDTIVESNDAFRTQFIQKNDEIMLSIMDNTNTSLETIDLSNEHDPEFKALQLLSKKAKIPFDLFRKNLFQFALIKLSDTQNFLFANIHHSIFDGFSTNVFLKQLKSKYESYLQGKNSLTNEGPLQYTDYLAWLKSNNPSIDEEIEWWGKRLEGVPSTLSIPTAKPRPKNLSNKGGTLEFHIGSTEVQQFHVIAKTQNTTLFCLLLAAFHVLLRFYTNENDFVIGVPVSGRLHEDLINTIGCFANSLPIRTTSDANDSFESFLRKVSKNLKQSYNYQNVSLDSIIRSMNLERQINSSPLFQVMFNMLPSTNVDQIGNSIVRFKHIGLGSSHFDLSLTMQENDNGLWGAFEYRTDLFDRNALRKMSTHFKNLFKEIVRDQKKEITQYVCLSAQDIKKQLVNWNSQPIDYKGAPLIQNIEDWAEKKSDSIAVRCKGEKYSYQELNQEANKIAHFLIEKGIKADERVIVFLDRSKEFIATVLGILKAGAAYVPIDPAQPNNRIRSIINDTKPFCLLTHTRIKLTFEWGKTYSIDQLTTTNKTNPKVRIKENQLAYVIFTSGSTGKPKGVMIEHGGLNDRLAWKNAAYPLSPSDVTLHTYSLIFDGAIINYFWPLCTGSLLVITSETEQYDPVNIVKLIKKHGVTTADMLPSLLQGLLDTKGFGDCKSLQNVFSGGEPLPMETVRVFYKKCKTAKLHNTYGPTEATVEASAWKCDPGDVSTIAPIGKPIAGVQLIVLNKNNQLVPCGTPGELYIGGTGLARGYLNSTSLTKDKFVTNPFSVNGSERLYRTGDLVKYRKDGCIEFLGRIDNQVKIRGFRIELLEIESKLLQLPFIDKAIVVVKGEKERRYLYNAP